MSNYDPFRIYARSQKASNKGQVLRKKYYPFLGNTFTQSDIQRVIDSLEQRGFTIKPPGAYLSSTKSHDTVGTFNVGEYTFPSISAPELSFSFSTLWNVVAPEFAELLDASPDSIINFEFRLDIISLSSWGVIYFPSNNGYQTHISLYFKDASKAIDYMPQNTLTSGVNRYFTVQSFNNEKLLNFSFVTSAPSEITKKEGLDSPYLMSYIETDPTIIVALKNKDYSVFNPVLYSFVYSGSSSPLPLTIPNSVATFRIHLSYDNK